MGDVSVRRALIAAYDKTGVADFARALVDEFGIEIISTGGTATHLKEAGVPVTPVEAVTGFPEMLDGRVKTLHPRIHAAILADRDNPEHMRQLADQGIEPIDMVVVNLYPFEETVERPDCGFEEAVEMIDIGGPCLLRAAAKNHRHVVVCNHWRRYGDILEALRAWDDRERRDQVLREGAEDAFWRTAVYDSVVRSWLGAQAGALHDDRLLGLMKGRLLRYGENPHQTGECFFVCGDPQCNKLVCEVTRADRELSFNNLVDADAALGLCAELSIVGVWDRLIAGPTPAGTPPTPARGTAHPSKQLPPITEPTFTRRHLPHIQRPGGTYFITFRTKRGELEPAERDLVMECCLFPDGKKVCLHATVVMPDHVHMLVTPLEAKPDAFYQLGDILHGIKGVSGRRVAARRGGGAVWLDESWDRIIRNQEEFWETIEYIRCNPTTAELDREAPYPWCVFERNPGWDRFADAAIVDLNHALQIDETATASKDAMRPWHRPLRDPKTARSVSVWDRLIAGPTPATAGPTPAGTDPARASISPVVVFIKHTNACGVGIAEDRVEAYRRAYLGDPNAAMGGILAVNFNVDIAFAEAVMASLARWGKAAGAGAFFVEVWLAPSFDDAAIEVIRSRKKWGRRVRLLNVGDLSATPGAEGFDFKRIAGGMLMQTRDGVALDEDAWTVVTERSPTNVEMADLRLAWLVCKHTKSNAITVCKDGMLIGNGAGQMSRVMSCRIATWLARDNGHADRLRGASAASDAFFPFRDGPDLLADAGVTALIQPGGSKRDAETIAACDERGVAMIFTGTRHFKH